MKKKISAMAARQKFGQMLEEAFYRGDTFIIERAGKPMAAVISIEQYHQWQAEREVFFDQIKKIQERMGDYNVPDLEAEITDAVTAVKESHN
jgi:prevent-host-death family protein